ncbi:hypothetical protein [Dapis sp. BLCC M229]
MGKAINVAVLPIVWYGSNTMAAGLAVSAPIPHGGRSLDPAGKSLGACL